MASKKAATMFVATAVVAIAAIVVAAATGVVASDGSGPRSYLTSWGGPGCTTGTKGHIASAGSCGCNHLRFHGGHEFNFRGETATLYSQPGCVGTPYQVFEDTQACGDFGWHSIHIDC
ncbi:Antimicrobial peptide 1 [Zea mays]|uniref:Antimicrobial peptide 1 n=1 Tax=Zea mays TaxID=4577 RepID=A0A3L6FVV6_MAIZE|nr:Antimicrobial peptide 1 [Zea mays]